MNLVLEVAYIAFVVYVCWVTLVNMVFNLGAKIIHNHKWTISRGVGLWYIFLWTSVLAAPVIYKAVV